MSTSMQQPTPGLSEDTIGTDQAQDHGGQVEQRAADTPIKSRSGFPLKPSYSSEDIALGAVASTRPGQYPFTRGIHEQMYRKRLWTFRQLSGFGAADASNERFKYLLDQGATAVSVCFDMPTKMGRDSDALESEGEVGRGGVAVDSLADMERLFEGIPLDQISTNLVSNAQSIVLLAFYLALAEKQGIAFSSLRGTTQNDMLKEFVAEKSYIFPPAGAIRIATDLIDYSVRNLPQWNPISISGYHIAEAGATPLQELAFCIANGIFYVNTLLARGLEIDEFAPRLSFFFCVHNDFFEEIAKFRAARKIWAELMRERFGAKNPRSWMLRYHTQTSGASLTLQQSENNIIRTTMQALAAVFGGTQSLHVNAYDEALSLPSETAARIAIRTHQIIAHESGIPAVADPLGGSYFVESLTGKMEAGVYEYLEKIESLGGVLKAFEKGYLQAEVARSAYEYQLSIEHRKRTIVAVNDFVGMEEKPISGEVFTVDEEEEVRQRERLKILREMRNQERVNLSLDELRKAARGDANLMPPVLEAVKAYATMGEITGALADVFGRYRDEGL
jgi:methylmalonyl-CoA mutase N-terminal domain/subunit